jgi:general secretion pathway protein K
MRRRAEPQRSPRGAALLTVLLLVAVIAVIAAGALERLRVSTRLAANAAALDQARGFAFAAETLATTRVTSLLSQSPDRVALVGGWSDRPFALPVPGGLATARVRDGSNCFNLNGLVTRSGSEGQYAASAPNMQRFANLIRLVGAPGSPEAIAAAAADWIDSDDAPLPGGAEDSNYSGYRTGGTLMADASELRAVGGVTPEVWAALKPWVCALPVAEPVKINVNTLAPEQAPLVAALLPDGNVTAIRTALLRRPAAGYESAADFWTAASFGGSDGESRGDVAVTSKWFALRIDVTLGRIRLVEQALVDARTLPARLVSRQWGDPA